jgi:hypothetical protein
MNNIQGQQLFNAIDRLRNEIRITRQELALQGKISPEWPVDDQAKQYVSNMVSEAAAGLSPSEQDQVKKIIQNEINNVSTVAAFNGRLLSLLRDINNDVILDGILMNIQEPGQKISNATNEIEMAIDKINDLNDIFSVITLGVSLITALVAASSGNFGLLFPLLPKLIQKVTS